MPGPPRGLEKPGQRVRQVSDEVRTTTQGRYDLTFRGEGSCSCFLGLKPGVKGASGQMAVCSSSSDWSSGSTRGRSRDHEEHHASTTTLGNPTPIRCDIVSSNLRMMMLMIMMIPVRPKPRSLRRRRKRPASWARRCQCSCVRPRLLESPSPSPKHL